MKQWFLYAVALALVIWSPFGKMDIGRLSPVETVWMEQRGESVYLYTDAGEIGYGESVQEVLQNLKSGSPGIAFLETADYLILKAGNENLLEQLSEALRPSCMICTASQMPDLQNATAFLSAHEPNLTLRQWQVERCALPYLTEQEGRFAWRDGTHSQKTV